MRRVLKDNVVSSVTMLKRGLVKPISRERQCKLHARRTQGDEDARQELILSVTALAIDMAGKATARNREAHDEVLSEALLGAVEGVDAFDPCKGALTTIVAAHIKKRILKCFAKQKSLLHIPTNYLFSKGFKKAPEGIQEAVTMALRPPVPLGPPQEGFNHLAGDDSPPRFQIADKNGFHILESLAEDDEKEIKLKRIEAALEKLKPREREIILLLQQDKITLEAVGGQYGITRERVRQIKEVAMRKLKEFIMSDSESSYEDPLTTLMKVTPEEIADRLQELERDKSAYLREYKAKKNKLIKFLKLIQEGKKDTPEHTPLSEIQSVIGRKPATKEEIKEQLPHLSAHVIGCILGRGRQMKRFEEDGAGRWNLVPNAQHVKKVLR